MSAKSPVPVRLLKSFGRFWWDFLVGDTPEIFVAVLVIIGATALLSDVGHYNVLSIIVLPIAVIVTLRGTVLRAFRHSRHK